MKFHSKIYSITLKINTDNYVNVSLILYFIVKL